MGKINALGVVEAFKNVNNSDESLGKIIDRWVGPIDAKTQWTLHELAYYRRRMRQALRHWKEEKQ